MIFAIDKSVCLRFWNDRLVPTEGDGADRRLHIVIVLPDYDEVAVIQGHLRNSADSQVYAFEVPGAQGEGMRWRLTGAGLDAALAQDGQFEPLTTYRCASVSCLLTTRPVDDR